MTHTSKRFHCQAPCALLLPTICLKFGTIRATAHTKTNRLQIFELIKRHFRGAPPSLHPTGFDRSRQEYLGVPIVGAHLATGLSVSVVESQNGLLVVRGESLSGGELLSRCPS